MGRTRTGILLVVLAAALGHGSVAQAKVPKAIWGPTRYEGHSQFPIYRDLGVDIYQHTLLWRDVATSRPAHPTDPDDPAYAWPEDVDYAVAQSERYGIAPLLMVLRTPAWANGGADGPVPPASARDYADFMVAASKRYPAVHHWMVWGEPIRNPNYAVTGRPPDQQALAPPLDKVQRAADRRYAELVDQTYVRLKARSRRNLIIGGNTTTSGDVDPWNWIKSMKLPDGRRPRMDLYGHNPFGARKPDLAKHQLVKGTADFCDLDVLAGWLDRYLARGGRNRKLKIFISEFTAPTDVPSYEFPFHLTRKVQAEWLSAAFGIARRFDRIYDIGWIGLRDEPVLDDGREARNGLIDAEDVRKPSYWVFKRG